MKPHFIYCNAVVVPTTICVFVVVVQCGVGAQSNTPKRTAASTQIVQGNVQKTKKKINPEQLVNVATIHVADGSPGRVRETLAAAQIFAMVMGAKTYGVLVRQKDHDRAISILKADAKKQHYWIHINP